VKGGIVHTSLQPYSGTSIRTLGTFDLPSRKTESAANWYPHQMPAIPTSGMPGHHVLRDRVFAALDSCVELQGVDFKESATWPSLQYKIARTAMAMGNLRDGGIIIVGASERGNAWDLSGITADHLATYNVDDTVDGVNRYASPAISFNLVLVRYRNGNDFLAIEINEFEETPFVCKRAGPPESSLRRGVLYVRPPGLAQTTEIRSAEDMHELLVLAAEKRARRMIEMTRRIGIELASTSRPFDDELGGL
jgi:hypothetical protein